jgi:hypothetical protein
MRRLRVSSFFADVTQQIHSFLASGVMARHNSDAAVSAAIARRKSGGNLWGGRVTIFLTPARRSPRRRWPRGYFAASFGGPTKMTPSRARSPSIAANSSCCL